MLNADGLSQVAENWVVCWSGILLLFDCGRMKSQILYSSYYIFEWLWWSGFHRCWFCSSLSRSLLAESILTKINTRRHTAHTSWKWTFHQLTVLYSKCIHRSSGPWGKKIPSIQVECFHDKLWGKYSNCTQKMCSCASVLKMCSCASVFRQL